MDELEQNVLEVSDLRTSFMDEGFELKAVDGVSFSVPRGKTLALVGESGCGKSVTALSILRLIEKPGEIRSGRILFHPADGAAIDITALDEKTEKLYDIRGGRIGMIFQEPMTALSPVHSVGNQVGEALRLHRDVAKKEVREQVVQMFGEVGIPRPQACVDLYPHELSGGMRQRVVIAMAMICRPELLIADEPTTALDVTIQAQILNLIRRMQQQTNTSMLLITHDLGVVAQMASIVAVMYLGRMVESASVHDVIKRPRHPYTMALLKSLPSLNPPGANLASISGSVPPLTRIPAGCPFWPRCRFAASGRCDTGLPPTLREIEPGHKVACVRAEEIDDE